MFNRNTLILLVAISFTTACSPVYNYQVFTVKGEKDVKTPEFENADIKITYDLWTNFGQLGLTIQNKTNAPLFIDLSQCALVINDVTVPIFMPSSYSSSGAIASSKSSSYVNYSGYLVSPSYSAGSSVSRTIHNMPSIFLPANSKTVGIYLQGGMAGKYTAPDFKLKRSEDAKSVAFKIDNSPYRYRLVLGYSNKKDLDDITYIEDSFWIESIQLMRDKIFFGKPLFESASSVRLSNENNYEQPYKKPERFYVKYQVKTN